MEALVNNNIPSSIVVSNDKMSKIIYINKNTKIQNFYQQIISAFYPSKISNFKLFYYEGYSHKKQYITNKEEYITANKKGIEYFYFCSNNDSIINDIDLDIDFLKYYSVIIFTPISPLNSEFQNNQRKKMQISINNYQNIFRMQIPEYETIDTETNPINKYIENALILSHAMKRQIIKEKQMHPEKFINIPITLSIPGLLSNIEPSIGDYYYILCLLGKILENNGIVVGIYKNNYTKDRVDLSGIQFLFSGLINKKKFRLGFYVDNSIIDYVIYNLNYRKAFINKWKEIIADRLKIDKKYLILTNPRKRTYLFLDLAFNSKIQLINYEILMKLLIYKEIKSCDMIPLLEGCRLSPNIFDVRYHAFYNNFNVNYFNQIRGGEQYIPPLSWTAYGINVCDKYDFGNNNWLGYTNGVGEFAVAYYGINNTFNKTFNKEQNSKGLMGNHESGETFVNTNNIRNPGHKCEIGAYFYKDPNIAENSCEIINIGGFGYKIMFMCRVNPFKIRQPENFQDCWILSPTPDEVRPYKVLIKRVPVSPLAIACQLDIKMCLNQPDSLYFQIMNEKDESYFNNKNLENFNYLSNYDYVLKKYSICSSINYFLRIPYNNNPNDLYNQYNNINEEKSFVWCLHKAVTQNDQIIPNGTVLYRGIEFKFPDIGVGTKFYFPEFLSTSRDINISKEFAKNGTLIFITVQNNGINGKNVYCRDIEYISSYPHQKEILFTSHCQFRITNIQRTPSLDYVYLICEGYHFKN